jgi:hypothetical protein
MSSERRFPEHIRHLPGELARREVVFCAAAGGLAHGAKPPGGKR